MNPLQRIAAIRVALAQGTGIEGEDVLWLCELAERADSAINLIAEHGHEEAKHHLRWLIDRLAWTLCDDESDYAQLFGDDPDWDQGIAP